MQIELHGNPDFGRATLLLAPDEAVRAESGAMSFVDPGLNLRAVVPGGLLGGLGRRMLGGESFFLAEYRGPRGGTLGISPTLPGEVVRHTLEGETLRLTAGSFLACTEGISTRTRFGGLRSLFSGEGAFLIEARGKGELLFNAYGAIVERELDGELVVDTGHLVAFEESIDYEIGGMGGLKSTLFSGEGLTMRMRGSGRVWLQTRTVRGTAGWVAPYLPA